METTFFFTIHNLNALYQSTDMVIGFIENTTDLVLVPYDATDETQVWQLIPNIVLNGYAPGFTLYNPSTGLCACLPNAQGGQVYLNDDPSPFGDAAYCWTMFGVGITPKEEKLTIQDFQRGFCMNASGNGIDTGTPVIIWPWYAKSPDNALWILRSAPAPSTSAK